MEIGARHWLIILAASRKFGKNVIFARGWENNNFVLFFLQVCLCSRCHRGGGKDFTGWGPSSRGGDPDFTSKTVGVVVRIVQFLGEINRFVDKPKFYVHGTLFPNPNTLHSC